MSEQKHACPRCYRRVMQNISNRCMYCGADLPKEHHLTQEEKARFLAAKMEQFKRTEENAESIISDMRRDFGIPEKKKRRVKGVKSRKENAAALAAALASINAQTNGGNSGSSS